MSFEACVLNWLSRPGLTDLCMSTGLGAHGDWGEGLQLLEASVDEGALKAFVLTKLSQSGKSWDAKHPFVDLTFGCQLGQVRLHAVFPPLSPTGLAVSLRRLRTQGPGIHWEGEAFDLLCEVVRRGDSLILTGSTGSGKTTLASTLLSQVPKEQRILALEDTPELNPTHPHFLSLLSRPPNADGHGEITLRQLLKQTLRMRPDRIVLGECRGAEVLDLLQALNTGHGGAMATLHANSPRDALKRLELLCHLATPVPLARGLLTELLAGGVRYLAHVRRRGPVREISQVCQVTGLEGDTILLREMINHAHAPPPAPHTLPGLAAL